jgi:peptide/nickel transport system permease protein
MSTVTEGLDPLEPGRGDPAVGPAGRRSGRLAELMAERGPEEAGVSLWRGAFRRMRRNPSAILGAAIVLIFVLVSVLAPVIAPYAPAASQWINQITPSDVPGPSAAHALGLDPLGSDELTQLIFGARQSLIIGVVSTGIGLVVGMVLGTIAGAFGGAVDTAVMRVVDIMLSIPSLLLAVSVAAVLGQKPISIMIAIAAVQVPIFARLLRGSMLSQRRQDYVLASFSLGLRRRTVVMSHVLPNSVGPVIVQATLTLATAIIEVAALSYLGLGAADPAAAEWGRMLVKAQDRLQSDPQLTLLPGACIAITALGFTLFGEALREALDPKSRR